MDAKERAEDIRTRLDQAADALAEVPELVAQAHKAEDWRALDYGSWQDYVTAEFGTSLVKLDRATRRGWTRSLKDAGLSQREIAPVTNVSQMQVSRDERETKVSPASGAKDPPASLRKTPVMLWQVSSKSATQ